MGTINFTDEHEDGSATVNIDFQDNEAEALLRLGILTALKQGLAEAALYNPAHQDKFDEIWRIMLEYDVPVHKRNRVRDLIDSIIKNP
jgi:uncharacterized protein with von Willebrand factor type A (vWA) domain